MKDIPASDSSFEQHHHIFNQKGDKNKENQTLDTDIVLPYG